MKILTWNVNGLRSLKGNLADRLDGLEADIVCFQETKITRDMLEEPLALVPGWTSYFGFSRKRTGYSGVATFCRSHVTPTEAEEGLTGLLGPQTKAFESLLSEFSPAELKDLDAEGRSVVTVHQLQAGMKLVVFNLYCPRADPEKADRVAFKYNFYKLVELRAHDFLDQGHKVVILGDVNTSHRLIDHCDPCEEFELHPGRQWLDHFLMPISDGSNCPEPKPKNLTHEPDLPHPWAITSSQVLPNQFLDSFRHLHPNRENAFTCWNTKMNCRSTNYGTRIDYIFVDQSMRSSVTHCDIHPEIEGSDHCPVKADLALVLEPAAKLPAYCTKNFPEFAGQQQKLSSFFQKGVKRPKDSTDEDPTTTTKKVKVTQKTLHSFFRKTGQSTERSQAILNETKFIEVEKRTSTASSEAWKALFKGPPPAPDCKGHTEKALLRTVKKKGPNLGRQFWCCPRGEGKPGDPEARCDFFKWL
eukprot:maker-scaffold893_size84343-snap-gene-0.21 protein:Tk04544 transcript:maker-scaffold893_size84343-snap-gene-0.21-mRNA-1 annotation:"dna-(apurinic or apyrimidinic site) lyase 2"